MSLTKKFAATAFAFTFSFCAIVLSSAVLAADEPTIIAWCQDSDPIVPNEVSAAQKVTSYPSTAVRISNVPTSSWTYGCSATSAGMIFGYYDRTGYSNMYTGPANGGLAPLTDLGNQCSLIATERGFDGRTTYGHVDDYWVYSGFAGSDPYSILGRTEHTWGDCVADYLGTNQWKWDYNTPTGIDANKDGATTYFSYSSGDKLYDYIPSAASGLPQTEMCHGMRLFAESRGYEVETNYTQRTDVASGGFTFNDYMNEIDNNYPVLIHVDNHTMVGFGYNASDQTVYLHDTWGDYDGWMTWGGSYDNRAQHAVTVMHLAPIPEPSTLVLLGIGGVGLLSVWRRRRS